MATKNEVHSELTQEKLFLLNFGSEFVWSLLFDFTFNCVLCMFLIYNIRKLSSGGVLRIILVFVFEVNVITSAFYNDNWSQYCLCYNFVDAKSLF